MGAAQIPVERAERGEIRQSSKTMRKSEDRMRKDETRKTVKRKKARKFEARRRSRKAGRVGKEKELRTCFGCPSQHVYLEYNLALWSNFEE